MGRCVYSPQNIFSQKLMLGVTLDGTFKPLRIRELGLTVEACTSRALPDSKSAILLPPSHKSKKMLPRKRDASQSYREGKGMRPQVGEHCVKDTKEEDQGII